MIYAIQMIDHFDKIIVRTKGIAHGTLFEVNSAFLLHGSKAARHGGPSALKVAWIGTKRPIGTVCRNDCCRHNRRFVKQPGWRWRSLQLDEICKMVAARLYSCLPFLATRTLPLNKRPNC